MNTGVVFYSRSNNTKTAALHLARKYGAEVIELVELNGRKGLFGLMKGMVQSSKGQVPKLQGNPWKAIEKLNKVYIMTPIWGGEMASLWLRLYRKLISKAKKWWR